MLCLRLLIRKKIDFLASNINIMDTLNGKSANNGFLIKSQTKKALAG